MCAAGGADDASTSPGTQRTQGVVGALLGEGRGPWPYLLPLPLAGAYGGGSGGGERALSVPAVSPAASGGGQSNGYSVLGPSPTFGCGNSANDTQELHIMSY